MPQIPKLENIGRGVVEPGGSGGGFSSAANIEFAGQGGRQVAAVGESLSNLGQSLVKVQNIFDETERKRLQSEYRKQEVAIKQQVLSESQAVDGSDIEEISKRKFKEMSGKLLESANSMGARNYFEEDLLAFESNFSVDMQGLQYKKQADAMQTGLEDLGDSQNEELLALPFEQRIAAANKLKVDYDTHVVSKNTIAPSENEKIIKAQDEKRAEVLILGAKDGDNPNHVAKTIKMLENPEDNLYKALSAKDRKRAIISLRDDLERKTAIKTADLRAKVDNIELGLITEDGVPTPVITQTIKEINFIKDERLKSELLETLNIALAIQPFLKDIKTPAQLANNRALALQQIDTTEYSDNLVTRAKMQTMVNNFFETKGKQMRDDSSAYVMNSKLETMKSKIGETPVSGEDFVEELYRTQDSQGLQRRILTASEATAQVEALTLNADPQVLTNEVQRISASYGKYSGKVLAELVAKGAPAEMLVGSVLKDSTSLNIVLNNHMKKNDINAAIKADPLFDNESFKVELAGATKDKLDGFGNRVDDTPVKNVLNEAVSLEAKAQILKGEDIDDAIENAVALVFDRNFATADGANNKLTVPKGAFLTKIGTEAQYQPQMFEAAMDLYADETYLSKSNVAVSPDWQGTPEEFYSYVADNGKWLLNPDYSSGMRLVVEDDYGTPVEIMDKNTGKPVTFDFEELSIRPPSEVIDKSRTTMGRGVEWFYSYRTPEQIRQEAANKREDK